MTSMISDVSINGIPCTLQTLSAISVNFNYRRTSPISWRTYSYPIPNGNEAWNICICRCILEATATRSENNTQKQQHTFTPPGMANSLKWVVKNMNIGREKSHHQRYCRVQCLLVIHTWSWFAPCPTSIPLTHPHNDFCAIVADVHILKLNVFS